MKKTVVITGCFSGFGFLSALKFHDKDWEVIAIVRKMTKDYVKEIPDGIHLIELDVTDNFKIPKIIQSIIDKYHKIDVLINNAGIGSLGLFEQHSEDVIRHVFEVNVFGMMNITKAVLPYMRKQNKGIIINISSIRGILGSPLKSIYASSKHAVQGFTESLAMELKDYGIRAKTIIPKAYYTEFRVNSIDNTSIGDSTLITDSKKVLKYLNKKKRQDESNNEIQEVVEKIFECATTKTPIHNIIGFKLE